MNTFREFRDYVQWLKGNYVPTEAKLRSMVESGFVFPETCKAILKPMEVLELTTHHREYTLRLYFTGCHANGLLPVPQ